MRVNCNPKNNRKLNRQFGCTPKWIALEANLFRIEENVTLSLFSMSVCYHFFLSCNDFAILPLKKVEAKKYEIPIAKYRLLDVVYRFVCHVPYYFSFVSSSSDAHSSMSRQLLASVLLRRYPPGHSHLIPPLRLTHQCEKPPFYLANSSIFFFQTTPKTF